MSDVLAWEGWHIMDWKLELIAIPWGWFVYFSDPDGNEWAVQQVPTRG